MIAKYERRADDALIGRRDRNNAILGNPRGPKPTDASYSHGIGINNKRIVKLL
jgi:hypothetical protein